MLASNNTKPSHWSSFWDVGTPEVASLRLLELYGALANNAASVCVVTALADERYDDHRFWVEVLDLVEIEQKRRREAAIAHWDMNGLSTI